MKTFLTQTITSFSYLESKTEVDINYNAVLGMDFPNEMKTRQELNLKGKSVFEFLDHKIIRLIDIS